MNKIYFDCTGGVSGDMVFSAMRSLLREDASLVDRELEKLSIREHHHHHHGHGHKRDASHGHDHRSYKEIQGLIEESGISAEAKKTALAIYAEVAKAEAYVHETTIADVHFHEVGRDEAVRNIVGIAVCAELLGIKEAWCSAIHDGSGFIECSHGTIPVPVPAVMAMRRECDYVFVADDVNTEMVTPSGLAALLGLGAVYCAGLPDGKAVAETVVYGKRNTGKQGFKAILLAD